MSSSLNLLKPERHISYALLHNYSYATTKKQKAGSSQFNHQLHLQPTDLRKNEEKVDTFTVIFLIVAMKKQKSVGTHNPFDFLSEELVFTILDFLVPNPLDKKAFSLVCKSFHAIEAKHRKTLKPFRSEHLPAVVNRYPFVTHLDLS